MKGSIGLKTLIIIVSSLMLLTSCHFVPKKIAPKLSYAIRDTQLAGRSAPFAPLTEEEKATPWGIEYRIGQGFAKKLDLYRAITAFERAEILAPTDHPRKLEMEHQILLSYYLGKRYKEIDQLISQSPLAKVDPSYPAFVDLLTILFDTKMALDQEEKACQILELIQKQDEKVYTALLIGAALKGADFERIQAFKLPQLDALLTSYEGLKKSPKLAGICNALLPGAGYFYVGQLQTAITALLLNTLFILSTLTFFRKKFIALGLLFLSFEIGWYGGGIYGASSAAVYYNQRVYEELATPLMNQHHYFPIHQLKYGY